MNKETYKAIKRIKDIVETDLKWGVEKFDNAEETKKDLEKVDDWIDKVAKDYEGKWEKVGTFKIYPIK